VRNKANVSIADCGQTRGGTPLGTRGAQGPVVQTNPIWPRGTGILPVDPNHGRDAHATICRSGDRRSRESKSCETNPIGHQATAGRETPVFHHSIIPVRARSAKQSQFGRSRAGACPEFAEGTPNPFAVAQGRLYEEPIVRNKAKLGRAGVSGGRCRGSCTNKPNLAGRPLRPAASGLRGPVVQTNPILQKFEV
jgi:hypothetical protein